MNHKTLNRGSLLFKETSPFRYYLLYRGQMLVFAGYCIVTLETLLGIKLGLTNITYGDTIAISCSVIAVTLVLLLFISANKRLLVWQEWAIFSVDIVFYLVFFSLWVYLLGGLRILGLLSSFIAITIVLSYTNFIQSLIMSATSFICYFVVIYFAINNGRQSGSLERESFLAFCLAPAFILIAFAARTMQTGKKKLNRARKELETANHVLRELNDSLQQERAMADIEMELAHDIQSTLFPAKPPALSDWEIAFLSRPRSGVSGDFYDFYTTGDDLDGISLFDVSGHGVAPALVSILTKPVLFKNFKKLSDGRAARILDSTNSDLFEQLEDMNIYITGILLRIRGESVEYVNAGHPDLLYMKRGLDGVRIVTDPECKFKGQPLGIYSHESQYCSIKFRVASGDSLLLFTDGIIESRNSAGTPFGSSRLMSAFSETSGMDASSSIEKIIGRLDSFIGRELPSDDITIIVAKKL